MTISEVQNDIEDPLDRRAIDDVGLPIGDSSPVLVELAVLEQVECERTQTCS
jgi:hypothetical protein